MPMPAPLLTRLPVTLVSVGLAVVLLAAPARRAVAQSLEEVVDLALRTNPEVLTATANRRAVDEELAQARAGFLPTADLTVGSGYQYTDDVGTRNRSGRAGQSGAVDAWRNDASLSLSQMLFDGFQVRSEVDRQRSRVRSAAHRVRETAHFVALSAIEVYLEVLRRAALVRLAEDNLAVHEEVLEKSRARAESGGGRVADLDQADARFSRARADLVQSGGNLREALVNYARVVGAEPKTIVEPTAPEAALPASADAAFAIGQTNNPSLLVAKADLAAAEAEAAGSRAALMPRFDVEVLGLRDKNVDPIAGVGSELSAVLRMRYNLYRGGGDISRRREALIRIAEARQVTADTRRVVEQDVRVAWNALQTARERIPPLQGHVAAADRVRFAYRDQFDIGQRSLLDVLDSENELFAARSALTDGEFTALFGVYQVLASTGQLLQALNIAAPMEADAAKGDEAACKGYARLLPVCGFR